MLIIFKKIFLILIIKITLFCNLVFGETFNHCLDKNLDNNFLFKKKKIELIDIRVNDYRNWQVNNIRILTSGNHVIEDKFKKRFKANIKIFFFRQF